MRQSVIERMSHLIPLGTALHPPHVDVQERPSRMDMQFTAEATFDGSLIHDLSYSPSFEYNKLSFEYNKMS